MADAKIYGNIIKSTPITKGWSEDKKYCVTVENGTKYLLRITPISRYEIRKALFDMLKQVTELDIPMCTPVEFGTCDDNANSVGGVYALHSWIDGEDLDSVLPRLSEAEQYVLGVKSGEILRIIHSIPEPDNEIDYLPYRKNWAERFNRKADRNIKLYQECELKADGGEDFIRYINENRELLKNRPQCFQHGDYHVGNMMIENGELYIIDFDRYDYGDPWEEFNRIVWSAAASPHFSTGQLRGYFGGSPSHGLEPPPEFFKLLAFYIASTYVGSLSWAIGFGQQEIDNTLNQAKDILQWFDNFKNPVPTWYLKDFYIQYIDNIPYKLKSPFNFSFINKYGKAFKVFDDQDSGNICFGVKAGEDKYFVKFAGAPTERANISAEAAVERMKNTVQIYQDLEHPVLSKLISTEETGGGFITVFEWTDGDCMGRQYPLSREKFLQMPLDIKLNIFDDILNFHAYVAEQGYVAIDFYDGSIMYDFDKNKTVIFDIEFYSKTPYINNMGRMWGSSRFMSPEEFQLGAVIDEITNVYTMGATAFALFGDETTLRKERDRNIEKWKLSEELFYVAKKAVSDDRNMRQQSIKQFMEEWKMAIEL